MALKAAFLTPVLPKANLSHPEPAKLLNERIDEVYQKLTAGGNAGRVSDLSYEKLTAGNSRLLRVGEVLTVASRRSSAYLQSHEQDHDGGEVSAG